MTSDDPYPPIADYGFLGDCHNWALVSKTGCVDWLCFERAGGHTAFARLLDWKKGGYCRLAPETDAETSRRYLHDTNVLETSFRTASGVVVLTDGLVLSHGDGRGPAAIRPHGQLVRRIRVEEGEVAVDLDVHPGFDYGLTDGHVIVHDETTATVIGGSDGLVVRSQIPLEQRDWMTCGGRAVLSAGDERIVCVTYHMGHEMASDVVDHDGDVFTQAEDRLDETVGFWRGWASRCSYDGPYREPVVRSALTLKALTDARTGAIIGAATTSLPEEIGGVRNWDYRFTWIRDSAWHLNALFGLGYDEEAEAFMGWLTRTTAGTADDLQVMYANTGARLIPETELDGLEGYRGSRPVRVGNGAVSQFQLDLYGELVSTAWHYHDRDGQLQPAMRHLLADVLDVVETRWREPDKSIWEVRGQGEQFVSSKVYCWVAADRLQRLATAGVVDVNTERCRVLKERIRRDVERYGVDEETGQFLRVYGTPGIDAANLLVVLEGFCDPDDERVSATLDAVNAELAGSEPALIRRYRGDDGLSGQQSAFFLTSFWLVSVHVERGELGRARKMFEELLGCTNDLGLLSEEIHPDSHELLGNFPQAISHVGLIDAAVRIHEAENR